MTDMQPKKMIILDILHILQKHSDKEHRLSQHDIQELLVSEYGMKVDRKTISRNIITLVQCNYPIEYGSNGDESILTNIKYNYFLRLHIGHKQFTSNSLIVCLHYTSN